ncbi:interferon-induced protein with tetratricopeptide repeats 5-like [Discoglossus pictus]
MDDERNYGVKQRLIAQLERQHQIIICLQDKLNTLQCQFTWDFEIEDKLQIAHVLQTVEIKIKHTTYQNLSTLYNLKAFLLQCQDKSVEALQCLGEAERIVRRDHPSTIDQHILVTYGNYAWIYYHLDDFQKVETYLENINKICLNLQSDSGYSSEIYVEQGWSLLAVGLRNGSHAKKCFEEALKIYPNDRNLQASLAYSIYACAIHSKDEDMLNDAIRHLEEIVCTDTDNWEAIVYLARVLQETNQQERALTLVEDELPHCTNPEVLRNLHMLFSDNDPDRAITILNRAIEIAPHYHLLNNRLAEYNMWRVFQISNSEPERRAPLIAQAISCFKMEIQQIPTAVGARIGLAQMYGINNQVDYEEIIYKKLEKQLPEMPKGCQQQFYFSYGRFFQYRKSQYEEAEELYKKGFQINPQSKYGIKCREKLEKQARQYQRRRDTWKEEEIYRFLQQNTNTD